MEIEGIPLQNLKALTSTLKVFTALGILKLPHQTLHLQKEH